MSNVIDALKRLERAGAEDSAATEKLKDACRELAQRIVDILPPEATLLPRGYTAWSVLMGKRILSFPTSNGDPLHFNGAPFGSLFSHPTRAAALHLAEDVATGWLDELAEWLETRVAEDEQRHADLQAGLATLAM